MVDGLGQTQLVDAGLQTALQEVFNPQSQHIIELHAGLVEHTDTDKTTNQGIALEQTLGVLLVESKKLTDKSLVSLNPMRRTSKGVLPSSTTDLGQSKLDTPDLTLVAQTVLADDLQFRVTIEEAR